MNIDNYKTAGWLQSDPTIPQRIKLLIDTYKSKFGDHGHNHDFIISCAPGRAEILGNHTDYNEGYTLSVNVTQNLLMLGEARQDGIVQIASLDEDGELVTFTAKSVEDLLQQKSSPESKDVWTNYVKAVLWSLRENGYPVSGFNALIQSTVPLGGGVASSAALELATAIFVNKITNVDVDAEMLISICKAAENDYAGAPCGYLDQGTVVLADRSWLQMSYRPVSGRQFTWSRIELDIGKLGYTLIVGFDPRSKHEIVDGKYALRQRICKDSIPVLQDLLNDKRIKALRDVSVDKLLAIKKQFSAISGETATNFVTHVIDENERVLQGAAALQHGNIDKFGELMTGSGKSSLELYNIAEGSPELRFVIETVAANQEKWGVKGIRNMGGGFNATTLALVATSHLATYKETLSKVYQQAYQKPYNFLEFLPAPSAGLLEREKIEI